MRIRDKESRVLRDSRRTWLRHSQLLQSEGIAASKSCLSPKKKRTKADTLWAPKRGSPPNQRPETDPMNPVTVLPETAGATKRQQRRTDPSIGGERLGRQGPQRLVGAVEPRPDHAKWHAQGPGDGAVVESFDLAQGALVVVPPRRR